MLVAKMMSDVTNIPIHPSIEFIRTWWHHERTLSLDIFFVRSVFARCFATTAQTVKFAGKNDNSKNVFRIPSSPTERPAQLCDTHCVLCEAALGRGS